MGMIFTVGDLASLIQTIVSFATLGVGIVTLIVLIGYARDTSILAKAAVQQVEQGYIPYLTLHGQWTPDSRSYPTVINHGRGPATNVRVTYWKYKFEGQYERTELQLSDFAIGREQMIEIRFNDLKPIVITYTSLSGQPYETRIEIVSRLKPATVQFRQLPASGTDSAQPVAVSRVHC